MTTQAQKAHADKELRRMGWRIKRSWLASDPIYGPWYFVETTDGYEAHGLLSRIQDVANNLANSKHHAAKQDELPDD